MKAPPVLLTPCSFCYLVSLSLGTLVLAAPWCMFYATKHWIYCRFDTDDMAIVWTPLIYRKVGFLEIIEARDQDSLVKIGRGGGVGVGGLAIKGRVVNGRGVQTFCTMWWFLLLFWFDITNTDKDTRHRTYRDQHNYTHINIYWHHLLCAHSSYLYYTEWITFWSKNSLEVRNVLTVQRSHTSADLIQQD